MLDYSTAQQNAKHFESTLPDLSSFGCANHLMADIAAIESISASPLLYHQGNLSLNTCATMNLGSTGVETMAIYFMLRRADYYYNGSHVVLDPLYAIINLAQSIVDRTKLPEPEQAGVSLELETNTQLL
jgi:hypothetical protein